MTAFPLGVPVSGPCSACLLSGLTGALKQNVAIINLLKPRPLALVPAQKRYTQSKQSISLHLKAYMDNFDFKIKVKLGSFLQRCKHQHRCYWVRVNEDGTQHNRSLNFHLTKLNTFKVNVPFEIMQPKTSSKPSKHYMCQD